MRTIIGSGAQVQLFDFKDGKHDAPKCFTIGECIGEGASCVAYRASDENGIPVKLKEFSPRLAASGTEAYEVLKHRCIDAFNQQTTLLKSASTANITASLSGLYHDADDRLWSAASDLFGRTFDRLIKENSLNSNLRIIRRIAESSKAYHEAGWLLLDLKPENILVIDSLGITGVNFFDFDSFIRTEEISSAIEKKTPLLLSSTEHYSAPELRAGSVDLSRIGARSDFFSIGAMLYEAVFGRPPRHIDCLPGRAYDYKETDVPAAACRRITTFLHRTLTASIDERFDSDDELIAAIDIIIRFTDSRIPHLSLSVPKPAAGFVGRDEEKAEIISKLRSGVSPLFVCGEGGLGKTQLMLKTAEDYCSDFDFYFVPYKGNLRDTLLSLPLDNPDIEPTGDNAYEGIMHCLRNECTPNSVLIIDSFDSDHGSKPETLLEDEDYADLIALPLKVVFTTRFFYDNAECVRVGSLPDDSLQQLIQSILPEEKESASRLISAFSGHTLAVKIAARSVEQGKISFRQIFAAVNPEQSLGERLCSVFRATGFDREEKKMLLSAALFPARGVSSDILYSLLPEGEYSAANRLKKAGWLDFDEYGNTWTVHDLVRNAIRLRRDTRPTADRVRALKSKLAEAENGLIPFSKRCQLNEIYGNIGRLPAGRKSAFIASAAVIAAAAVCMVSLLALKDEKPLDPDLTLNIALEEEDDKDTVSRRLKALAGANLQISDTEDGIEISFPLSALGDYNSVDEAIRLFINRRMSLYAIAYRDESHFSYSFESVNRDKILSVSTEYGAVPGYSLFDYGIDLGEKYYYLRITFDDQVSESIYECIAENRDVTLKFDIEENYSDYITLDLLLPAEERNTFYIVDSRINGKRQAECLEYSLKADELAGEPRFEYSVNPGELWEDPEAYSAGKNQCSIEELPEDYVILGYAPSSPKDVSDAEFTAAQRVFKDMLDSLGRDYAFGLSTSDSRELICALGTETMSQELAECLASYSASFSIRGGIDIIFNPGYYETSASVERNDLTGGYELVLQFEDEGKSYDAYHRLKEASEKMMAQGLSDIYLGIGNYKYFLRAEVDSVITDGRLVFASMPMFDADVIGDEHLGFLSFFAHDLTAETHLGYSLKTERFSSDGGECGLKSGFDGDEELLALLAEQFPNVTVRRDIDSNYIRFYLNYELGEDFVSKTADAVSAIWNEAHLADGFIDRAVFYPLGSPETGEYIYLEIIRHWYTSGEPVCNYVCHGGRLDDCFDAVKNVFTSEEFLNSIGGGPITY